MTKVLFPNVYHLTHAIIAIENIGDAERHSEEASQLLTRAFFSGFFAPRWILAESGGNHSPVSRRLQMALAVLTLCTNACGPSPIHFIEHHSIVLNGTLLQGLVYKERGAGWRVSGRTSHVRERLLFTSSYYFLLLRHTSNGMYGLGTQKRRMV